MSMNLSITDKNLIRAKVRFGNGTQETKIQSNTNLNQPAQDTFEKFSTAGSLNQPVTEPQEQKSVLDRWLTKENLIIGGAGIAMTAGAIALGIITRRGLSKTLNTVQGALAEAQGKLKTQAEQIAENQKIIAELKENLSKISDLPADLKSAKEEAVKEYQKIIQNPTLSYDPLKPPTEDIGGYNFIMRNARRILKLEDIAPFSKGTEIGETVDTVKLKNALSQRGSVEISMPVTSKVKPVVSDNASISGLDIPDLGRTVNSDFKLNYGKRIAWSEEKIARDIMQNFYDGHGNTLDGVRLAVKQLPDGQYSIKVSGLAKFDYENLQYMGSGSKLENPYNAGGFGEGAKVLVATMLGKGDTKSVRYACSDWELTFDAAKGIIRRTLKKAQNPIEGNTIEFTTGNKKLADAMLDSVNYFEHSQNPDFRGLHFDSKDFGFRFLTGKEAKGSIYLTQRFEYDKAGSWESGVDNLDLIFKRKPDPVKFERITGVPMPKDRDRQFLTVDDVKNYTQYFAREMSDEDLVKALITTKSEWHNIPLDSKKTALKSFINALAEEMYRRDIAIDFSKTKFVSITQNPNDAIKNMIEQYNYIPCSDIFSQIGMSSAEAIFKQLSVHKAIAPTVDEIKKLKILEAGMQVIKDDIEVARRLHLANPIFKFQEGLSREKFEKYLNCCESGITKAELKSILSKYKNIIGLFSYSVDMKKLSDSEFEALKKDVEALMTEKIKKCVSDSSAIGDYYRALDKNYYASSALDIGTRQYFQTFKDFSLIDKADVTKPRYIFDRSKELAKNTLGEAIIARKGSYDEWRNYEGHWVDKEYFDTASFNDLLATWLHEICHKSGGDGTNEFTYTLTDMIKVLLNPSNIKDRNVKLAALAEIFDGIKTPFLKAAA